MSETLFELTRKRFRPGSMQSETAWNGSAFVYGICCLAKPGLAIEVGACTGATSIYIAKALKELGQGAFVAYEQNREGCDEIREKLRLAWPDGRWHVEEGDFFSLYDGNLVHFAFLDIDPKSRYIEAYERLHMASGAILVAHDLTYDDGRPHVLALSNRMNSDGWSTFGLPHERGFLVGLKL